MRDVSFELRRGEWLGLIGHNGAGNQAAGQPLGRLPQAARRVRRHGKARINTTLLKMLNGLIKPDAGSITMRGRVGALIALGAGFNPILTGREPEGREARRKKNRRLTRRVQRRRGGANQNIYINGSVLGLTKKEIDAKIDEIIDFAEIREAIDMPVENYSSGMAVRLGFAVATSLNPDILILDEVLAVGGAEF